MPVCQHYDHKCRLRIGSLGYLAHGVDDKGRDKSLHRDRDKQHERAQSEAAQSDLWKSSGLGWTSGGGWDGVGGCGGSDVCQGDALPKSVAVQPITCSMKDMVSITGVVFAPSSLACHAC